ncbi:MAG: T9SS type A sorting domain-containing protein [Bacteroidales bacterium]|nr:T9SS type A sorting domain-containing protein [Bacteroidales bacterium]
MKNKRLILSVVFLLGIGLTGLQAQTMHVLKTSGEQTSYVLNNIQKLTFSGGNITVSEMGGSSTIYAIADLRYLSFNDYTTSVQESESISLESISAYPNPVKDVMNIDFSKMKDVDGTISILSLEGKLLQSKQITETGIISLDVSSLPRGVYICRYSNKTEIKTVKIIKQ